MFTASHDQLKWLSFEKGDDQCSVVEEDFYNWERTRSAESRCEKFDDPYCPHVYERYARDHPRNCPCALVDTKFTLDLRGQQMSSFCVTTFLRKLVASEVGLKTLIGISSFTNLVILNVYGNELTELPTEIGKLTLLTDLQISKNAIASVPHEIGQCVSLVRFVAAHNRISSLPFSFRHLKRLRFLNLCHNALSDLDPRLFLWMRDLKAVKLNGNLLSMLPYTLAERRLDGERQIEPVLLGCTDNPFWDHSARVRTCPERPVGCARMLAVDTRQFIDILFYFPGEEWKEMVMLMCDGRLSLATASFVEVPASTVDFRLFADSLAGTSELRRVAAEAYAAAACTVFPLQFDNAPVPAADGAQHESRCVRDQDVCAVAASLTTCRLDNTATAAADVWSDALLSDNILRGCHYWDRVLPAPAGPPSHERVPRLMTLAASAVARRCRGRLDRGLIPDVREYIADRMMRCAFCRAFFCTVPVRCVMYSRLRNSFKARYMAPIWWPCCSVACAQKHGCRHWRDESTELDGEDDFQKERLQSRDEFLAQ